MFEVFIIGLGGFLGAVLRYGLSGLVHRHAGSAFPMGTLVVNVLGCLAIGVLVALVEERAILGPSTRLFLLIGLLGSFTTFSTFGYETIELLQGGSFKLALLNVGGNLFLGLGAVIVGRTAMRIGVG